MTRPRLLFYCQHSVGLGHLVRSVHLVEGLARDFDVTLLNGGPWPVDLPQPSAIDIVHLPALGLDEDYTLISRDERFTVDEAVGLLLRSDDPARAADGAVGATTGYGRIADFRRGVLGGAGTCLA